MRLGGRLTGACIAIALCGLLAGGMQASAEMIIEQRAEIIGEASWYPRKAGHDGQADGHAC